MVKHPVTVQFPHIDLNTNTTATEQTVQNSDDLLPREPCLQALAALRHAKWFQVCFQQKLINFFWFVNLRLSHSLVVAKKKKIQNEKNYASEY